jgi:DNA-binding response OmpR family regulator
MQAVLELHGFHVTACVDGEDAESVYIKQQPFDLLVTDLEMPGKSGADLAASLCRRNPSLPVLIVSGANVDAGQLQEFTSKGWIFISKPFAIPNLIDQITALLATAGASAS